MISAVTRDQQRQLRAYHGVEWPTMSRQSYSQGQKDGSRNRYKPTGKKPYLAGIFGWNAKDEKNKKSYDKGYENGSKQRKR